MLTNIEIAITPDAIQAELLALAAEVEDDLALLKANYDEAKAARRKIWHAHKRKLQRLLDVLEVEGAKPAETG